MLSHTTEWLRETHREVVFTFSVTRKAKGGFEKAEKCGVVVVYKKTFLMFHKTHFVSCAFWWEVYCSSVSQP